MKFESEKMRFTKEHEWAYQEGGSVTIGITEYAAKALGDIVFVELPQPGAEYEAGDILSTVESVKTVSDIFTPVAGKVAESNTELENSPEKVNEAPYEAWIVRLDAPSADLGGLMTEAEYLEFCKTGEEE